MRNTRDWIDQTNIYEVNLRQYTEEGSFAAFAQHLPRLRDMGVETLWFMPITPISQKEKKGTMGSYYACSDYTSINSEFGTMDDFKNLVNEAHAQGFRVIIDWVANHTGWDHHWTKEHPDWYERDLYTGDFKRASGMDDIIELDFTHKDLRAAMIEAMKFWVINCDIDGFRCDLAFWVELDFWLEAIPKLNALKPLFWLAESDPLENPSYMQVFDASYSWTWMHHTKAFYEQKHLLSDLVHLLSRYQAAPGLVSWFTSNHDENSWNGSEYEKYGPAALAFAVHSCTWPGIPLVYSGQELPNYKRLNFFDKDCIEWTGTFALHEFYKTLLTLHHTHPALNARALVFNLPTSSESRVMAYLRKSGDAEVIVLLNLSPDALTFDLLDSWLAGRYYDVFTGAAIDLSETKSIELAAWGYRVLSKSVDNESV
jgi:glycosidase